MSYIDGIAASNGIAIAKAYQLTTPDLSYKKITVDNPNEEVTRLDKALDISKQELEKIKAHTKQEMGDEHAEIFSAHLLVMDDPELIKPIKDKITTENVNAEAALDETANMFI